MYDLIDLFGETMKSSAFCSRQGSNTKNETVVVWSGREVVDDGLDVQSVRASQL